MKETPLLFTPENVRKVLAGTKTQTRRVVKPGAWTKLVEAVLEANHGKWVFSTLDYDLTTPYGEPGDRLWVRETVAIENTREYHYMEDPRMTKLLSDGRPIKWIENDEDGKYCLIPHYRATDQDPELVGEDEDLDEWKGTRWRPSIHMPKWACRLWLELTAVRVERVHGISVEDALAEGMDGEDLNFHCDHLEWWKARWAAINGKDSWDANPWVWVLTFKKTP